MARILHGSIFRSLGNRRIRARLEKPAHLASLCKVRVSGLAPRDESFINQKTLETILAEEWQVSGVEEVFINPKDKNVAFVIFATPELARRAASRHNGKYSLKLKAMKPPRVPKQGVQRKEGQRMVGVVNSWARGFGMITPHDEGEDVFIHYSDIQDGSDLLEDKEVEFTLSHDEKGWRATDLTGGVAKGLRCASICFGDRYAVSCSA